LRGIDLLSVPGNALLAFHDDHSSCCIISNSLVVPAQKNNNDPYRVKARNKINGSQDIADAGFEPADGVSIHPNDSKSLPPLPWSLAAPESFKKKKITQVHEAIAKQPEQ